MYINVSSKLPEHKCNSDTAIFCWSRRRERTLSSCWRHSGLKRKSNAISFVPGLSSPSSDLPRSFFACTLTRLLSLPLRFPEYLRYRLSLSPLPFPLSLFLSPCVMTDGLRLVRANRYSLHKATTARHYVKNSLAKRNKFKMSLILT